MIRRRRLAGARGMGSGDQGAAASSRIVACLDLVSTSDIANSPRGCEDNDREHDHMDCEYKERRVPDETQQVITSGAPAQRDCYAPCGDLSSSIAADVSAQ